MARCCASRRCASADCGTRARKLSPGGLLRSTAPPPQLPPLERARLPTRPTTRRRCAAREWSRDTRRRHGTPAAPGGRGGPAAPRRGRSASRSSCGRGAHPGRDPGARSGSRSAPRRNHPPAEVVRRPPGGARRRRPAAAALRVDRPGCAHRCHSGAPEEPGPRAATEHSPSSTPSIDDADGVGRGRRPRRHGRENAAGPVPTRQNDGTEPGRPHAGGHQCSKVAPSPCGHNWCATRSTPQPRPPNATSSG